MPSQEHMEQIIPGSRAYMLVEAKKQADIVQGVITGFKDGDQDRKNKEKPNLRNKAAGHEQHLLAYQTGYNNGYFYDIDAIRKIIFDAAHKAGEKKALIDDENGCREKNEPTFQPQIAQDFIKDYFYGHEDLCDESRIPTADNYKSSYIQGYKSFFFHKETDAAAKRANY